MAGYSGTPLAQKLGIKSGSKIFLVNAPAHYQKLVASLPSDTSFVSKLSDATDIVHLFATTKRELEKTLRTSLERLRRDAVIWVSWPKKSSKVATDITEDTVRQVALPRGLVDVKVCAVDDVWSGLKLVIRKQLR
jgi:hypothetical protein